ncbi:MAG: hypothetical protein H6618_05085 [Deltaproteobacteria bacterium]|nr:hypothetical protein [Deltaproteobacteria bacterium]
MKWITIVIFFFMLPGSRTYSLSREDIIPEKEISFEITKIIGNLGLNCSLDEVDQALFVKEMNDILDRIVDILSISASQLLMKPDFPTVCHVLTAAHIDSYQEDTTPVKEISMEGALIKATEIISPTPRYYWPKYFIEVTEKGNDFHHAFAKQNRLYLLNRKISDSMKELIDEDGALNLTKKVFQETALTQMRALYTGTRFADRDDVDWNQFFKAKELVPFERMRMRADQSAGEVSFDVAVWPVILSKAIAEKFSVCQKGGYGWQLDKLAQTCPLALSSDAYAYWDTGVVDYLDPMAIFNMANSSSPDACLSDKVLRDFDQEGGQRKPLSYKDKISAYIEHLSQEIKSSLQSCSWPILGEAEIILKQALTTIDPMKWQGPYCSLWGSLLPRMSTHNTRSDYSYANKAMQFKLFAHEFFGLPRGRNERWSLAYPWEDSSTKTSDHALASTFEKISNVSEFVKTASEITNQIKAEDAKSLQKLMPHRSEALLSPGSPLMTDASYSEKYFKDRIKAFEREKKYLTWLTAKGEAASGQAREELNKEGVIETPPGYESPLSEQGEDLKRPDEEAVWERRLYCHISKEEEGIVMGSRKHLFEVPDFGILEFEPVRSEQECRKRVGGKCLKKDWKNKCISRQNINYILLHRYEIVGYIPSSDPVIRRPGKRIKTFETAYSTPNTNQYDYSFMDEDLRVVNKADITLNPLEPDISSSEKINETITRNEKTADLLATAARSDAWVGNEMIRMRIDEIIGINYLPGDRRIYTIWEEVTCNPGFEIIKTKILSPLLPAKISYSKYSSCEHAIRFEIRKFVQRKLLRRICDALNQPVGKPWK